MRGNWWARVFEYSGWESYGPFESPDEAQAKVDELISARPAWADRGFVALGRYGEDPTG